MRRAVLVLGALVLTATVAAGGTPAGWHTFRDDGITVRYPPGWHATGARLTPVTSPAQILAVASYRLPRDNRGAEGCQPKEALDRLPHLAEHSSTAGTTSTFGSRGSSRKTSRADRRTSSSPTSRNTSVKGEAT